VTFDDGFDQGEADPRTLELVPAVKALEYAEQLVFEPRFPRWLYLSV
jgi:hypothetical protein